MTMTLDRAELLRVCMLVRPALAVGSYIPAYQHIQFKGGYATAYNDVAAISVRCKTSFERCLPGDLLTRTLLSFSTKEVGAVFDEAKGAMVLSSGRSKIKLQSLLASTFPFSMPMDEAQCIVVRTKLMEAIDACLRFVGKDESHPARMGVTLQADGSAYATDGVTITACDSGAVVALPAGVPVILPTFFCEQLVKLHGATKIEPELYFLSGALLAEFGEEAIVYTKTLVDIEPLDFDRILQKIGSVTGPCEIPTMLDAAIDRALLVLGAEQDKVLRMTASGEVLTVEASGSGGTSDDGMAIDRAASADCRVDPVLLARGLKQATRIAFLKKAVVLMGDDGSFNHYISHVVE